MLLLSVVITHLIFNAVASLSSVTAHAGCLPEAQRHVVTLPCRRTTLSLSLQGSAAFKGWDRLGSCLDWRFQTVDAFLTDGSMSRAAYYEANTS